MKKLFVATGLTLCALFLASSFSNVRAFREHIEFLASDAYVTVGDVPLILPFVALPGYVASDPSFTLNPEASKRAAQKRLNDFRVAAISADTAPVLDKIEVVVRPYGLNDFDTRYRQICSHLTRDWSQAVCDNPRSPLVQALPRQFYLADRRRPDAFDSHYTVRVERMGDRLRSIIHAERKTSIACDPPDTTSQTLFCTAMYPIHDNLLAVWTVWSSETEKPAEMADRQGKAIATFVRYSIGPVERYRDLIPLICEVRNPQAKTARITLGSGCDL